MNDHLGRVLEATKMVNMVLGIELAVMKGVSSYERVLKAINQVLERESTAIKGVKSYKLYQNHS